MLRVHPHDAGVVHHLDEDHDVVFGLHDALEVVVQAREHRWPGAEAEQAALGERKFFRGVERPWAIGIEPRCAAVVFVAERTEVVGHLRHGRGSHRWPPTVGWIVDDRVAVLAVDGDHIAARIDPERVVAADVAGTERVVAVAAFDRRGTLRVVGTAVFEEGRAGDDRRGLLRGHELLVAHVSPPLDWRQ